MQRQNSRFGPCLAIHRERQIAWRDLLTLIIPGILAMMAPLGYGLYIFAITYTKHGFALALIKSRGWIFFSLISFVIFLGLIFFLLFARKKKEVKAVS